MAFGIETEWRPQEAFKKVLGKSKNVDAKIEEVTTGTLKISANGRIMTKMVDDRQVLQNGPSVSAFRIAEWLLWNWWRIRWEPSRSSPCDELSWLQAHNTASIGGGWLWPNVTFDSDGRTVCIKSVGSESTPSEPVSFLGQAEDEFVPVAELERGIDEFVESVMARLKQYRLSDATLPTMWRELQEERNDVDLAACRRLEALLGFNPDEGDHEEIDQLVKDKSALGEQAVDEIAANAPFLNGAVTTADALLEMARRDGFEASNQNSPLLPPMPEGATSLVGDDFSSQMAPWQVGQKAAQEFRSNLPTNGGPIADGALCELCGLPNDALRKPSSVNPPMAYALSTKSSRHIVLRAHMATGRRFEAARLIGDRLLVTSGEPLQPATRAHTFRQKAQRAFAAEFLCPIESLHDEIGNDHSNDSIEEVAGVFEVSPVLVATQLRNHGLLSAHHTKYAPH